MFDWFKGGKDTDSGKVIPFPEKKEYIQPKEERPPTVFYRLGLTDNNRLAFQMGYTEITMNKQGVDNLIRQLQTFSNQLEQEDDNIND